MCCRSPQTQSSGHTEAPVRNCQPECWCRRLSLSQATATSLISKASGSDILLVMNCCLYGEEDHEFRPGRLFGVHQPQVELAAALNHLFDELIDRVLIAVRETGHRAANVLADPPKEASG